MQDGVGAPSVPCQAPPRKINPPGLSKSFLSHLLSLLSVLPKFADNYAPKAHNRIMLTNHDKTQPSRAPVPCSLFSALCLRVYSNVNNCRMRKIIQFLFCIGRCAFGKHVSHLDSIKHAPISVQVNRKITVIFLVNFRHLPTDARASRQPKSDCKSFKSLRLRASRLKSAGYWTLSKGTSH
jgi:hypothetical protein